MEILTLGIVGVIVSGLVQVLKNRWATGRDETLLLVAGISVVAGLGYYLVQRADLLEPIMAILGFSTVIYSFIIKRFEQ